MKLESPSPPHPAPALPPTPCTSPPPHIRHQCPPPPPPPPMHTCTKTSAGWCGLMSSLRTSLSKVRDMEPLKMELPLGKSVVMYCRQFSNNN